MIAYNDSHHGHPWMGQHDSKQVVVKANVPPAALCKYATECIELVSDSLNLALSGQRTVRTGNVYKEAKSGVIPAQLCMQWVQTFSLLQELIQFA